MERKQTMRLQASVSAALLLILFQVHVSECFQGASMLGSLRASGRLPRVLRSPLGLSMVATREGTGDNRMTDTGFDTPLVQKVKTTSTAGYEWKVRDDLILEKKLNLQEKVKIAKPGLNIFDEIDQLAAEARAKGGAQFMDEDQIQWRLKWLGVFHKNKYAPGTFMWRLRVPNGIVNVKQWRAVASVIESYDKGSRDNWEVEACGDVTTRQNIQLRGLRLEDLPVHWKALRDAGLFSVQSGMDNVRNLVGNPLAGLDPFEIVDTRKFCEDFTNKLTNNGMGNPEYTNLPRKFNVCFVGSHEMFEHPDINDIAYVPAKNDKGEMGWNIEVGGLLSASRCEFAIPLGAEGAWVPQDKYWAIADAILTTFRDYGYRYTPRTKCRMMFLIDDMGIDRYRIEVAKRYKASTGTDLATEGHSLVPKEWERRELLGVHKQKDGNNWVGINIPTGRFFADEAFNLAKVVEKYGKDEVRMTVEEKIIVPHIKDADVEAFVKEIETLNPRWSTKPRTLQKGTVSCTGNQFCSLSNINTKGNAIEIADRLDEKYEFTRNVRIHWTGCANTCGQIQIGDIGLLGVKGKDKEGNPTECVDIYEGGGIGQTASIGTLVKKGVSIDDNLEEELSKLLEAKYGAKLRPGYVATPKPKRSGAAERIAAAAEAATAAKKAADAPAGATATAVAAPPAVKPTGPFTMDEVKKHNTKTDCWIVISGQVYDVTGWLKDHPGGAAAIMPNAGGDATMDFTGQGHSAFAKEKLKSFLIGDLVAGEAAAAAPAAAKTETSLWGKVKMLFSSPRALDGSTLVSAPLIEKEVISRDTRRFRFALPSPRHKLGLPVGNHMQVYADIAGEKVMRPYTPTSSDRDQGFFDLVIKVYGKTDKFPLGGKMSQHLDSLKIGDTVQVKGPLGHFVYQGRGQFTNDGEKGSVQNIGLIAGGTGITPAYQVIKAILENKSDPTKVSLIFANQTPEDILLKPQLDAWAKEHPDRFKLFYTVDRAGSDWKGGVGFVNADMIKAHMPAPSADTFVAVCGPPAMVDQTLFPALKSLGYAEKSFTKF